MRAVLIGGPAHLERIELDSTPAAVVEMATAYRLEPELRVLVEGEICAVYVPASVAADQAGAYVLERMAEQVREAAILRLEQP